MGLYSNTCPSIPTGKNIKTEKKNGNQRLYNTCIKTFTLTYCLKHVMTYCYRIEHMTECKNEKCVILNNINDMCYIAQEDVTWSNQR